MSDTGRTTRISSNYAARKRDTAFTLDKEGWRFLTWEGSLGSKNFDATRSFYYLA
jgi:hypothetical protein